MRIKAKHKVIKNADATEYCGVNAGGASWRDISFKISSSGELKLLKPIGNSIMAEIRHIVTQAY